MEKLYLHCPSLLVYDTLISSTNVREQKYYSLYNREGFHDLSSTHRDGAAAGAGTGRTGRAMMTPPGGCYHMNKEGHRNLPFFMSAVQKRCKFSLVWETEHTLGFIIRHSGGGARSVLWSVVINVHPRCSSRTQMRAMYVHTSKRHSHWASNEAQWRLFVDCQK